MNRKRWFWFMKYFVVINKILFRLCNFNGEQKTKTNKRHWNKLKKKKHSELSYGNKKKKKKNGNKETKEKKKLCQKEWIENRTWYKELPVTYELM